jgi:hypothetical protein
MTEQLRALPTIGPRLAADPAAVGSHPRAALRAAGAAAVGSAVAAARLAVPGLRDRAPAARAPEGAPAGVRWTTGHPP